jgi:hypothetical protein
MNSSGAMRSRAAGASARTRALQAKRRLLLRTRRLQARINHGRKIG